MASPSQASLLLQKQLKGMEEFEPITLNLMFNLIVAAFGFFFFFFSFLLKFNCIKIAFFFGFVCRSL